LPWPAERPNLVTLADEAELPFDDLSIDRVLMVHAVEGSEQLRPMMREAWRVLSGGGRLLVVVPNRRGVWARLDRTPFGLGSPYSLTQLNRLLRDTMFTPLQSARALFVPPGRSRMLLRSADAWEEIGSRWFPRFGGVAMVEASKEIYAAATYSKRRRRRDVIGKTATAGPRQRQGRSRNPPS
jgi:ubiquinone/menaquinone biosynthesis C-methylase UbiE